MKEQKHHKEKLSSYRNMKDEELGHRERDLTEELFWMSFKHEGGQLEKPGQIKHVRRELARVKTLMAEKATAQKQKGAS